MFIHSRILLSIKKKSEEGLPKAEAVIFPRDTSLSLSLSMASISALGSPSFSVLKPSFPKWSRAQSLQNPHRFCCSASWGESNPTSTIRDIDRRQVLISSIGVLAGALCNSPMNGVAAAAEFTDMPALRGKDYGKTKMRYPDYTETDSGLQYKDLRLGSGPTPKMGETVVVRRYHNVSIMALPVDWDGYTIGYYGRIFEARNKTKGGSFVGDDKDFFKFRLGSQEVIPAFEEAVSGMALGGVRRCSKCFSETLPPELGYPENDYNKSGPRPTTFSGQRALDFVLRNQGLIDKTLLFDIELLKIIPNK
ncbi:hypothetical protein Pint_05405 [Pistacia integerrima]|uniref:Uncharacterized protein n=1 Tax=Pistacia integerrima TaxID=434235 RepID=A0ACC0Z6Z9_9ROSI|nr:hypothetical protein Pint_05405 [Pistacia integerrima]